MSFRPRRERGARLAVLALALALAACGGEAEVAVRAPGTIAFGVFGDAPYAGDDRLRVERLIDDLNREDLDWVLHVGDILWYPCTDEVYEDRLRLLERIRHPLIYTPGDNEWVDCWGEQMGAFEPLERLKRLREIFFPRPGVSLGGRPLELESQARASGERRFAEFVENVRWVSNGIVFATLHVPGGGNGTFPFPGRTAADDVAAVEREEAAIAWLAETLARARELAAPAVVLALHAEMGLAAPPDDEARRGFERLIEALEREVAGFDGEVVLVHGDYHDFIVDRPLADRAGGPPIENLTRLQVFGSPAIGWVRVTVAPGPPAVFTYEPREVVRGLWWVRRLLFG